MIENLKEDLKKHSINACENNIAKLYKLLDEIVKDVKNDYEKLCIEHAEAGRSFVIITYEDNIYEFLYGERRNDCVYYEEKYYISKIDFLICKYIKGELKFLCDEGFGVDVKVIAVDPSFDKYDKIEIKIKW